MNCMDDDVKPAGMERVDYQTTRIAYVPVYECMGLSWAYGRLRYQPLEGDIILACDPER